MCIYLHLGPLFCFFGQIFRNSADVAMCKRHSLHWPNKWFMFMIARPWPSYEPKSTPWAPIYLCVLDKTLCQFYWVSCSTGIEPTAKWGPYGHIPDGGKCALNVQFVRSNTSETAITSALSFVCGCICIIHVLFDCVEHLFGEYYSLWRIKMPDKLFQAGGWISWSIYDVWSCISLRVYYSFGRK